MENMQQLADKLATESHFIGGCLQAPKAKHTPTEWAYDEDDARIYYDDGNVQPTIAYVEREGVAPEQVKADGYLLAAAPQMLDTLRWVEQWIVRHGLDKAEIITGQMADVPILGTIRAAIAKANGTAS